MGRARARRRRVRGEWRTGRGAVAIAPHVSRPGGLAALRACIVAAYGAMAAHAPAQAYRGEWSAGRVRATCGFEAADASVSEEAKQQCARPSVRSGPRFWTRIMHHDDHDHLQRARAPNGAQNAGLLGLDRHIGVRLSSTLSSGHRACRRCTAPGHPAQACTTQ